MEIAGNIALSRMIALKEQMDVTANNIANMNTTGYKAVEMRLGEQKVSTAQPGLTPGPTSSYSMVAPLGMHRDTRTGVITPTGNPLDLAIQGPGYFSVQTSNGDTRYTRNGVFQISATGQLVDMNGNAVQSTGGEINIPKGTTSISIGQDGIVSTPKGIVGQIAVVNFDDQQSMKVDGNNDLEAPEGSDPQTVANPRILQGSIEGSNVNSIKAMTQMVDVERAYQSAANMVQEENDRTTNAIKDLARIN